MWILSSFTVKLPEKAKTLKLCRDFKDGWRRQTFSVPVSSWSWRSGNFWCRNWNRHHQRPRGQRRFHQPTEKCKHKQEDTTDMNTLLRYMEANGTKNGKIGSSPVSALDHFFSNYFLNARRKNREEYEPATLSSFQHSIQRYLTEKKYPFNILNNNRFEKSRKVLAAIRKSLVFTSTARQQTTSCSGHKWRQRGYPFWSWRIWRLQSSCASKNTV